MKLMEPVAIHLTSTCTWISKWGLSWYRYINELSSSTVKYFSSGVLRMGRWRTHFTPVRDGIIPEVRHIFPFKKAYNVYKPLQLMDMSKITFHLVIVIYQSHWNAQTSHTAALLTLYNDCHFSYTHWVCVNLSVNPWFYSEEMCICGITLMVCDVTVISPLSFKRLSNFHAENVAKQKEQWKEQLCHHHWWWQALNFRPHSDPFFQVCWLKCHEIM